MKKISRLVCAVLGCLLIVTSVVIASNRWELTAKTWAENQHEGYFNDEYIGTVSVCGADTVYQQNVAMYPSYTRLTYNVQGEETIIRVNSTGDTDTKQRIVTKKVNDEWNMGAETTCKYWFGLLKRSHNIVR